MRKAPPARTWPGLGGSGINHPPYVISVRITNRGSHPAFLHNWYGCRASQKYRGISPVVFETHLFDQRCRRYDGCQFNGHRPTCNKRGWRPRLYGPPGNAPGPQGLLFSVIRWAQPSPMLVEGFFFTAPASARRSCARRTPLQCGRGHQRCVGFERILNKF